MLMNVIVDCLTLAYAKEEGVQRKAGREMRPLLTLEQPQPGKGSELPPIAARCCRVTGGGTGAGEILSKVQCPSGPGKQMGAALEKDMGTKACDLQVQRRGRQGDRLQRQLAPARATGVPK